MEGARRNVLLIVADQWRADCLSAAGHPAVRTPHLDRLAAGGALFRCHYANASPCGPSRACLLTGQYLQNHRSARNGTPLDARHTNLALEARRAGLAPALFGYTDTAADPRGRAPDDPALRTYEGVLPGFDPIVLLTEDLAPWAAHLRARGHDVPADPRDLYRPAPAPGSSAGSPPGTPRFGPAVYGAADSDTAFLTDRVLDWLDAQDGRPWFAHVAYIRPHPPWVVPAPYDRAIDPASMPPPVRAAHWQDEAALHPWLAHRLATQAAEGWVQGAALDPLALDGPALAALRAAYAGLIAEVDAQIGRLIGRLEALGQLDDTLVVFTSDHGEMLGDHWMLGKETFHDQAFAVPLIVRAPGRPGGQRIDAFTESVDLMPTVLDWLGLPTPRACDGRSLIPLLAGAVPSGWRHHAAWELDFRDAPGTTAGVEAALGLAPDECVLNVLRGERFAYVHFAALPPLFFDRLTDPHQLVDRAADPACAPAVLRAAQALLSWRMRHDERTLTHLTLTPDGVRART